MRRWTATLLVGLMLIQAGCGLLTYRKPDFENAETGDDDQVYVLDDLRDIANDEDLTTEEKREAYRELGIEDADLIDSLLTLEPTDAEDDS
jgi:hypothetical protein